MRVAIEEVEAGDTARLWPLMSQLRPHFDDCDEFVRYADEVLRPEGYRFIAACAGNETLAVAGFLTAHNFAWGHHLYVHDLVTDDAVRSRGHGRELLDWLEEEARRLGCGVITLDSGLERPDAHRFYFRERFMITSFHFARGVKPDA